VSSAEGGFGDFIIEEAPELPGMMHLVGIESPGLTAAPAIAEDMAEWVDEHIGAKPKATFEPGRETPVRFREQTVDVQAQLVDEDPEYGHLVCRCELVTRKEVKAAIHNPLGVRTINGIKYRSRAMMGRCQGGFCSTRIVDMLAQEFDTPLEEISLKGPGSQLFVGSTKDLRKNAD
jgi:glycerol-3-phosphate dehydrogenase